MVIDHHRGGAQSSKNPWGGGHRWPQLQASSSLPLPRVSNMWIQGDLSSVQSNAGSVLHRGASLPIPTGLDQTYTATGPDPPGVSRRDSAAPEFRPGPQAPILPHCSGPGGVAGGKAGTGTPAVPPAVPAAIAGLDDRGLYITSYRLRWVLTTSFKDGAYPLWDFPSFGGGHHSNRVSPGRSTCSPPVCASIHLSEVR